MTFPNHPYGPETLLLHGGQEPDPATGSRAVPIYQTTSYVFRDTDHAQNLFALAEPGNIYTRIMNPTVDAFEQRMALLEDGAAAVATSSGMSAITLAILNIAGAGDEIVASSNLYGGTYNLFVHTLPRYGIHVRFIEGSSHDDFQAAITSNTKAIFAETIGNPSLDVLDIEKVAAVAHSHHIPLIIDNTFATPYVCQPFAWGADIVVHSATKWIGGHGTTIGGVVIDSGRFNWDHEKFPGFTTPDESYNGIRYADLGPAAYAVKLRVQLLRDIGACLSPQNAFLLLQGLETLHLRIKKHADQALEIARYLEKHEGVEWVRYPGLPDHPTHPLAEKYFHYGHGSIVVFGISGGREAGRTLIDSIGLWSHVANVGDAKSLIIHPASTTHQQLNEHDLKKSGVTEELVRLSVGLESVDDLIDELDAAIRQATGAGSASKNRNHPALPILQSSLDRSEGQLRKRTIGFTTSPSPEDVNRLAQLGYTIVDLSSEEEAPTYVDILHFDRLNTDEPIIEQQPHGILWINEAIAEDEETTISGIRIYDAVVAVRTGKSISSSLQSV